MGRVRDIIENERGLISDTVATDKEVQATSGYRNHIIDGSFSLCQKSDTPIDGTGYSCVDMWWQDDCKIERAYDENGLTYAKCTCTDAEDPKFIRNKIENVKLFNHKTVTISFEIDSPDGLTEGLVKFASHDADDNFIELNITPFVYNDVRTRYTFTLNINQVSLAPDFPLYVYIYGDTTSNNNDSKVFNVYNVQLEFGDVATPFEIEPAGITLSRAQRYYEIVSFIDSQDGMGDGGHIMRTIMYKNTKRTTPTLAKLAEDSYQTDTSLTFNTHPNVDALLDLRTGFSTEISPSSDNAYVEFTAIIEADARF